MLEHKEIARFKDMDSGVLLNVWQLLLWGKKTLVFYYKYYKLPPRLMSRYQLLPNWALNWEGKQQHTITPPLGIFPIEMQET